MDKSATETNGATGAVRGGTDLKEETKSIVPAAEDEPDAAAATEEALGLDRAARRAIQEGLAAAGFEPGGADGRFGPGTRAALRDWQRNQGVAATGYLTETSAAELRAAGEASLAPRPSDPPAADPPRSLAPGEVYRDCDECPEMVGIPGGSFQMGCVTGLDCEDEELPVREVRVDKFELSKYEVTFEEYDQFTDATGRNRANDEGWGRGRRPVINVSWDDAVAYARWLSERSGKRYRLPSEAEWEYAARAGTATLYSWGNEIDPSRANYSWDNVDIVTAPLANGTDATTFSRLQGTVLDETGARIPGAEITATDTETNVRNMVETNDLGEYSITLIPGTYDISAMLPGFKTKRYLGIRLDGPTLARLEIYLPVGASEQQVVTTPKVTKGIIAAVEQGVGPVPVGSFPANGWGLYDMHGNVGEWVQDCWNDSYRGAPTDGSALESENCEERVARGGCWDCNPEEMRSFVRAGVPNDELWEVLGFRVARTNSP